MSDKYYWLKLKRDFFKRHDIRIVEGMPNGKEYILFYLKLLCESVDHEGSLRFSDQIPYNEDMLAIITNTNVDIVRSAVKVFSELQMMDILDDGTIFLKEMEGMLGYETEWAKKKREYRERQKTIEGQCPQNVLTMSDKRIEKEKELETEKEKDIRVDYSAVIKLYNDICISFPRLRTLSDKRKEAIRARLRKYSMNDFREMFANAEASDFLKGANKRNWSADFDWLMADANFAKVLDGNYANKERKGSIVIPMPEYMNEERKDETPPWLQDKD